METRKPAKDGALTKHKTCERCLEPEWACACLDTSLGEFGSPEVVWLASRPIHPGSMITREKKHRYAKACREVERLNRLYAGKVQHFLLPVSRTSAGELPA